jgi:hypothetical protein
MGELQVHDHAHGEHKDEAPADEGARSAACLRRRSSPTGEVTELRTLPCGVVTLSPGH